MDGSCVSTDDADNSCEVAMVTLWRLANTSSFSNPSQECQNASCQTRKMTPVVAEVKYPLQRYMEFDEKSGADLRPASPVITGVLIERLLSVMMRENSSFMLSENRGYRISDPKFFKA